MYLKTWKINFIPPIAGTHFLPAGLWRGSGVPGRSDPFQRSSDHYTAFIAPGILAINIMQNGFFETTYASYVRMYYQKTFDAIMATPLTVEEIILGEIFWGASRSLMATGLMMIILSFFGLLAYPWSLGILPVALLGGLAFGSVGMCFTALVPEHRGLQSSGFSIHYSHVSLFRDLFPLGSASFVGQDSGLDFSSDPCGGAYPGHGPEYPVS